MNKRVNPKEKEQITKPRSVRVRVRVRVCLSVCERTLQACVSAKFGPKLLTSV